MKTLERFTFMVILSLSFLMGCGRFSNKDVLEIKKVIRWYDEALTRVYSESSIKPLLGLASENEIGRINMILLKLNRERKVMESKLKRLDFTYVEVTATDIAVAETLEKWRFRYINKQTGLIVHPWQDKEYRMRYYIVKKDGRWIVSKSSFAENKASANDSLLTFSGL